MAGRRENQGLNFVRCMFCATSVIGVLPPGQRLEHREDGTHAFVDVVLPTPISSQAGLASIRRPDHRTVSMHADVRAVLDNVRMVQFYCGYMPEKPRGWDDDAVRMQLADAVYVLERLADAIAGA
ncbi:MAG TPA: hypothetical protein VLZ78_05280 [Terrimesophilobacter sp.]|nr:hypothetical protein [Terrimesophilobacter sp.]